MVASIGVKDAITDAKTLAIFILFSLDKRSKRGKAVAS